MNEAGKKKSLSRNWIYWVLWIYWSLWRFSGNKGEPCGQGETKGEPGNLSVHVHNINKQTNKEEMKEWTNERINGVPETGCSDTKPYPTSVTCWTLNGPLSSPIEILKVIWSDGPPWRENLIMYSPCLCTSFQRLEQLSNQPPSFPQMGKGTSHSGYHRKWPLLTWGNLFKCCVNLIHFPLEFI